MMSALNLLLLFFKKSDSDEQLNAEDFAYGQEAYHHYKLFTEVSVSCQNYQINQCFKLFVCLNFLNMP